MWSLKMLRLAPQAKESVLMHLIPTLRRRFGRKAKKWLENLSSRSYVVRKKNQKSGSRKGRTTMTKQAKLGGSFTLPGTPIKLVRMGYGAMQLAGPEIWGPPRDVDAAIAVLREAVASGVNHIDTSDYYGPHVTNQIIKKALHPYPADLVIVTKLGARRGEDKSWLHALSRQELIDGVHDNLRNLGLEQLQVVNLRVGPPEEPKEGSIEAPLTVLAELQRQGLIGHLGIMNVFAGQLAEAPKI